MKAINTRGPRPWTLAWKEDRGCYLKDANGFVVAEGFPDAFAALSWAVER